MLTEADLSNEIFCTQLSYLLLIAEDLIFATAI